MTDDQAQEAAYAMAKAWTPKRLSDAADNPKPETALFVRDDKEALLYRHMWNVLMGLPETGKSWIAGHVALQALDQAEPGDRTVVVIIDYEDTDTVWYRRLKQLGATDDQLTRVLWVRPDMTFDADLIPDELRTGITNADLVLLDSVNEAMAGNGFNPMDSSHNPLFRKAVTDPIQKLVQSGNGLGVCLALDHTTLADELGRAAAYSGITRLSGTRGVLLRMKTIEQPAIGKPGAFNVFVSKDTNSEVRKISVPHAKEPRVHFAGVAQFRPLGTDGDLRIAMLSPRVEVFGQGADGYGINTEAATRVLEVVDAHPGISQTALVEKLTDATGRTDSTCREYLKVLVAGGHLEVVQEAGQKVHRRPENGAPETEGGAT